MGEGWGDILAYVLSTKKSYDRTTVRPIGAYVLPGRPLGIRQAPYSTDLKVNDLMYESIRRNSEVHAVGTIWATMLFEGIVSCSLIT
jgi:extracellular elastinolytic metalloproteinase